MFVYQRVTLLNNKIELIKYYLFRLQASPLKHNPRARLRCSCDVGTEQEKTILCQKLNVPIYTWIC